MVKRRTYYSKGPGGLLDYIRLPSYTILSRSPLISRTKGFDVILRLGYASDDISVIEGATTVALTAQDDRKATTRQQTGCLVDRSNICHLNIT